MDRTDEEKQLINYALGELGDEEQRRVEERLLTDDEYYDLLLAAEDDLIDDYVRSALSARERERFESHFLTTAERRERLRFAATLNKYVEEEAAPDEQREVITDPGPAWWKRLVSAPSFRLAAAAIIIVALGLAVWRVLSYESEVSKGMAALNDAYGEQRPVESRISKFKYAPFVVTRGGEQGPVDKLSLSRARNKIQDGAADRRDAESLHALGVLLLAEKKFDEAIEQFEKALKLDDKSARLHADLGAALLEKAKVDRSDGEGGKSFEEFALSLEHLSRALELDVSSLEALFNRAILYKYMMLPNQAEEDWRRYLEKDPNSKWADEAREKLKELEEQQRKVSRGKEELLRDFLYAYESGDDEGAWNIISRSREVLSGRIISEQLLDKYLESSAEESSGALKALSYVGEMESRKAGDLYTSGLAEYYRSSSPESRKALARARGLIRTGHERYAQNKPIEAIKFYTEAKQLFGDSHDERESLFAEFWVGFCYREAGDTERSLATLEPLARTCEQKNYKWLLMRSLLILSSAQYNLNEYSKAIGYGHGSLELAEQIGDTIGMFNALSVLVEEYRYINNSGQALRCVEQSLSVMSSCPLNPIQIGRHYGIVASAFNTFGFHTAAINYQKEMVRQASSMSHAQMTTMAYANLGLIYSKLGKLNEALETARLACETARTNADENIRKHMIAYSALQKANIYREAGDWGKATDSYDECIGIYDSLDFRYYTYQAHKGRLSCYIAQGEDALAKEELQKTLGLAEKYRSKILEADNRNNFFESEQSIYDLGMDFEYSRMNNREKAYEYSEASRARSLFDLMNASGQVLVKNGVPGIDFAAAFPPLSLEFIKQNMPDRAQIIQYAVLDNKLFIWYISRGKFKAEEQTVTQKKLTEKCRRYLEFISRPAESSGEDERDAAKELFDLLIKPVEQFLDERKQVCVVADKVLNYLPFDALISSSSGKYLVEKYSLLSSPSTSAFIRCSEWASDKGGKKPERLLSIGNPSFDRKVSPLLGDLGSAATEAEQIRKYYEAGCPLIGSNATKARVMDEMKKSDVIHFALHSVADPRSPMRSKLVLAKEPSGNAPARGAGTDLAAYEIYGLKLARARLVVLSACETGIDRYYAGEGMLNIARPFLVAGVPLTVASLWPVDTDSTAELMVRFHRNRKSNKDKDKDNVSTVDALRQAQIDMLGSQQARLRRPYSWAAFITIGGYATY